MRKKVRIVFSDSTNPYFNFAAHEWLFRTADADVPTLFISRMTETVSIGRKQNAYAECDLEKMRRHDTHLIRRESGGKTVYHDVGVLNFSMQSANGDFDRQKNLQIIVDALQRLGIEAATSNDVAIVVDDCIVGSSAYKINRNIGLHHGMLMLYCNLSNLSHYLTPLSMRDATEAPRATGKCVANLIDFHSDITYERVVDAIVESYCEYYCADANIEKEVLSKSMLADNHYIKLYYDKMQDRSWQLGQLPDFSHHYKALFAWGTFDLHLNIVDDTIVEVVIFSNSQDVIFIDTIESLWCDCPCQKTEMRRRLQSLVHTRPDWQVPIHNITTWLEALTTRTLK